MGLYQTKKLPHSKETIKRVKRICRMEKDFIGYAHLNFFKLDADN
jgi:predicted DNA-binding helix-hairpin-helix protein